MEFWEHQLESSFLAKKQRARSMTQEKHIFKLFSISLWCCFCPLSLVLYMDLTHLCNILIGTCRSLGVGSSPLPQVFILLFSCLPVSTRSPFFWFSDLNGPTLWLLLCALGPPHSDNLFRLISLVYFHQFSVYIFNFQLCTHHEHHEHLQVWARDSPATHPSPVGPTLVMPACLESLPR